LGEATIKPATFDYVRPGNLAEALGALGQLGDDATILAGGQSLVPMLALRLARPGTIVDINRIPELSGIRIEDDTVRIGATTRQAEIYASDEIARELPLLAAATRYVGHVQTRSRGTIGGSLGLSDPAAEYPAVALALDAEIEVHSIAGGVRRIEMDDFIQGPYMTAVEPGELIVAIHYPRHKPGRYVRIDEIYRRPGDFALSGLCARIDVADGRISEARLAWLGMGSSAVRSYAAENELIGMVLGEIDPAAIARIAIEGIDVKDNVQATVAYRRSVGAKLCARVLKALIAEASA
jgi:carbon-monoxide dehydrogenase medium subunit